LCGSGTKIYGFGSGSGSDLYRLAFIVKKSQNQMFDFLLYKDQMIGGSEPKPELEPHHVCAVQA
jgi:hypothetical protein